MRMFVTGSAIRGLPVVTIAGGEDIAEVRDLIYDPQVGRIVGLTLNKRGFLAGRAREVLPAAQIHAIGPAAVMVADDSSLTTTRDAPSDVREPPRERDVTGDEVLTEHGTRLGKVRDVVVLLGSNGEVVGYEIEAASGATGYIPLPAEFAVSGSTLLVPEATRDFVENDLAELDAAFDDFRAKVGAS